MNKVLLLTVAVAAALMLFQAEASACGCPAFGPPGGQMKLHLDSARVAFAGEVLAITDRSKDREVTFRVAQFWKGRVLEKISVSTDLLTSSCSFPFETGKSYLVFASLWEGRLYTAACSLNRELTKPGDVPEFLGKGRVPTKKRS